MLREEINTALKDAMKAREEHRVSTLRLVNAALKQGYAGRIDFGKASGWVKQLLAG